MATEQSNIPLFGEAASAAYDEKNRALAPISENMHFLISLVLADLPPRACILCVGIGTGAEILSLARAYPEWTFTGIDPSASMLAVCQKRLADAGITDRCRLIHGYIHDLPAGQNYDAALSILVAHFIRREDRSAFYSHMHERLKTGGVLIDTEISFNLDSPEFPSMLGEWSRVQKLMGATPASLQSLPHTLRNNLHVLPPDEVESLLRAGGIRIPVRFFQSFMINGWFGKREP
jgi:tRNA (cmo5U34)-methyltransferase